MSDNKKLTEDQPADQPALNVNKVYDKWAGELTVIKDRRIPGYTSQREITEMQFQVTSNRPNLTNIRVTPQRASDWNSSHYTARRQSTEMLFPAGEKLDMRFKLNDETETWDIVSTPLQTA